MAEFPMMPFWTDAYLGDTMHLTTIEHGAYMLLLITAWRSKDGKLPDNDVLLARYCRLTLDKWKKIKPIIQPYFSVENGKWIQGRLQDERKASLEFSKSQSKKGKARWLINKETGDAAACSGLSPAYASPSPFPSPSPSPSPLKEKNVKKEKAIRTLEEFENHPLDGHYEKWFQEKCPSINRHEKRDQIVRWCRSKGKTYKDYWSALQDWAIRDQKEKPEKKSNFKSGVNPNIAAMKGEL